MHYYLLRELDYKHLGSKRCHAPGCNQELRREDYEDKLYEDGQVHNDHYVRTKILDCYNNTLETYDGDVKEHVCLKSRAGMPCSCAPRQRLLPPAAAGAHRAVWLTRWWCLTWPTACHTFVWLCVVGAHCRYNAYLEEVEDLAYDLTYVRARRDAPRANR